MHVQMLADGPPRSLLRPRDGGRRFQWPVWVFLYVVALIYYGALDQYKALPSFLNVFDVTVAVLLVGLAVPRLGRLVVPTPALFVAVAGVIAVRTISALVSPFYEVSLWISVFRYVEFLAVLIVFATVRHDEEIDWLFRLLLAFTLAESVAALYQVWQSDATARGTGFGNRRGLYELQIMFVLYYLGRPVFSLRASGALDYLKMLLLLLGVLVTLIRTAWLELIIALLIGLWWAGRCRARLRGLLLPVALIVAAGLFFQGIRGRWPLAEERVRQIERRTGSVDERLALWEVGLKTYLAHPLLGVGSGGYARNLTTLALSSGVSPGRMMKDLSVHNTVINMLAETGTVGLLAYLGYAVSLGFLARALLRRQLQTQQRNPRQAHRAALVFALSVSCMSFLVVDTFAVASFTPHSATIIGMLVGTAGIAFRKEKGWLQRPSVS